jgi:hypothetical protein
MIEHPKSLSSSYFSLLDTNTARRIQSVTDVVQP